MWGVLLRGINSGSSAPAGRATIARKSTYAQRRKPLRDAFLPDLNLYRTITRARDFPEKATFGV
jgi:hypothetical protein